MVEQPEVLEDHADAAAQSGDLVLVECGGILSEERNKAARGLQGEKNQAQQSGLASARRPRQELERLSLNRKGEVP